LSCSASPCSTWRGVFSACARSAARARLFDLDVALIEQGIDLARQRLHLVGETGAEPEALAMADGFELLPHRLERFEAYGDLGPCGQSQQDAEQQEEGRERRGKAPDGGANLRGVEAHGGAHHFRPEASGQLDAALEQIERLAARSLHPMMADLVVDRLLGGQRDLEVPQRARAHHRAVRLDRHLPI
jgi:hypothetical protein